MAVHEETYLPAPIESATGAPETAHPRVARRVSAEVVLEVVLVLLAAVLFGYMLAESFRVHPDVARLPRIASGFGFLVLVLYVANRARTWGRGGVAGQIMDIGFDEEGLSRRVIVGRTLRFVLSTLALFGGIRLVGFHVAVPLYVFGYLLLWGRVRWYWAAIAAIGFEAYIYGAYDVAIRSHWPAPLIPFFPG